MPWQLLIIPLIALAVALLAILFRGEEAPVRDREQPAEDPSPRTTTPPAESQVGIPRHVERPRPPLPTPAPPPLPSQGNPFAIPRTSSPAVPPARPPSNPPASTPPASTPDLTREIRQQTLVLVRDRTKDLLPPAGPSLSSGTSTRSKKRKTSPVFQEVKRLLGNPRSATTAIVLREILDRPLSQRR